MTHEQTTMDIISRIKAFKANPQAFSAGSAPASNLSAVDILKRIRAASARHALPKFEVVHSQENKAEFFVKTPTGDLIEYDRLTEWLNDHDWEYELAVRDKLADGDVGVFSIIFEDLDGAMEFKLTWVK